MTLVPIFVVVALLIPCLFYLLRIRRRPRRVQFMATYEDLARQSTSDMQYVRRPYTDAISGSGLDSESQYDTATTSIPSASLVHLDMVHHRRASSSRSAARPESYYTPSDSSTRQLHSPVQDPFADNAYYADPSTPLVSGGEPGANERSAASRWGRALSPTLTVPGPSSSSPPPPPPTRVGTKRDSRPPTWHTYATVSTRQEDSVDLTNPMEWADMEDPFANPNKRFAG